MSKTIYYLENVVRQDEDKGDIHKAVISCYGHLACVVVYGTDDDLTDRVIKVIKGLNEID